MGLDIAGIGAVASLAENVIGRFFPDKTEEERAKLAAALTELQGQLDTNKVEASSDSMFVAGWRPFVGWVCGSGFAIQFVVGPLLQWLSTVIGGKPIIFPPLDLGTMMPLLLGMLGLGGMRSWEKQQGVANGH
jgi:Holin of 3TMs, for gene-transfer release